MTAETAKTCSRWQTRLSVLRVVFALKITQTLTNKDSGMKIPKFVQHCIVHVVLGSRSEFQAAAPKSYSSLSPGKKTDTCPKHCSIGTVSYHTKPVFCDVRSTRCSSCAKCHKPLSCNSADSRSSTHFLTAASCSVSNHNHHVDRAYFFKTSKLATNPTSVFFFYIPKNV